MTKPNPYPILPATMAKYVGYASPIDETHGR